MITLLDAARPLVKGCSVPSGSAEWCQSHCPIVLPKVPARVDGSGTPLRSPMRGQGGGELGELLAFGEPGRAWTVEDQETLDDFARLAVTDLQLRTEHAIAARSETELRVRTRMLELRSEVGALLTRSGALGRMLQDCAEVLQRRLAVPFFRIWTLDRDAETLVLRASAGLYTNLDGDHARIPVGRFKIGQIAERRRPHLSNALAEDPLVSNPDWVRREGMVAFAGYPLVVDDRLVGVMATFSRRVLDPIIIQSMASIADDLAQCIERKQAEAGRLATEARKAAILESAMDCIITIDHEGRVLEFNPASERTFGYAREQAVGRTLAELIVPPGLREAHRAGLARYVSTGDPRVLGRRIEIEAMRADGTVFPVELAISEVRDEGAPVFTAYLRDITERKQSEEALRASEQRFRILIDHASDAIMLHDGGPEFRVLDVNRGACDSLGHERDDLIGMSPLDFDAIITREQLSGLMERLARREEVLAFDSVHRRKDGSTFPVEIRVRPFQINDKDVVLSIARDITKRKRVEKELNDSNAMLESIRRIQARYIASDWQTSNVFDKTLRAFLDFTGSSYGFIGEVRLDDDGRPFLKTHAITDISWDEASRRFFAEHAPDGMEFHNLHTLFGRVLTDGRPVISNDPATDPRRGGLPHGHPPLEAFLGLPVHQGDQLIGMIAIANRPGGYDDRLVEQIQPLVSTYAGLIEAYRIDQRRRRAESSLRLTQFAIDRAGDSVFWLDRTGAFRYANDQGCRALGYSREELLRMTVFDIHTPGDSDDLRTIWADHWEELRRRGSFTLQATHLRKDGSTFPVELTVNFIASEGLEISCTFARDMTAREQAAVELRQARDAAEAANRAKSEFLANMSHEVRTPMAAVLGFGDMLLDPRLPPVDRDRALQGIRSNGAHLLQIIDDILDLSKIEAGKFELFPICCDPRQVVHEAHSLLRGRAAEKGIALEITIEEPIPRRILTDPLRLRQVLVNFLSNAIKFTPNGDRVGVRLFVDRPADAPPSLCYEVTDQGIGMDREQLSRLFRPFVQVDSTATRRHGGTGLGLSISRHLAEALGGRIGVQSEPGRGSRFTLRFPIDATEAPCEPEAEVPAPEGDSSLQIPILRPMRGSVLVAEDSPPIQVILRYHLASLGLDAEIVENGERAVERALSGAFDLILMDMQMPELDGYGATSSLRLAGFEGPIIALTAHALREDRDRCLRAGCTDYLPKPINVRNLAAILTRYLPLTVPIPSPESVEPRTQQRDPAFEALVRGYLDSLRELFDQVRRLRASGDLNTLRSLSHRTRGVAAMYGFPDLGESAALLEDAIVEGQEPGLIAELTDEFEQLIAETLDRTRPG
jgi:PAS domain S-box-containing protein